MKLTLAMIPLIFISFFATADTSTEESNKKLVVDFYTKVLFERKADAIDQFIGDVYIQHNPYVPDGKEALRSFISATDPQPTSEIVRAIAEEDLVVLHVKTPDVAIVDIFRVKDNQIVEHWDVIQGIPSESQNDNTMF